MDFFPWNYLSSSINFLDFGNEHIFCDYFCSVKYLPGPGSVTFDSSTRDFLFYLEKVIALGLSGEFML